KPFNMLRDQLLDRTKTNPVGITTALHGGGGFGKTLLAQALCHDEAIRDAFDDGILFVRFGQDPNLLDILNRHLKLLNPQERGYDDTQLAAQRFATLLEGRDMLVVLDDVWHIAHITPFTYHKSSGDTEKRQVAYLITTRRTDVLLTTKTVPVTVDQMETDEAVNMLVKQLEIESKKADLTPLAHLVERLGNWALLIEIIGATLKVNLYKQANLSLKDAIASIEERLTQKGINYFRNKNVTQEDRNYAISKSLEASVSYLTHPNCFEKLGIFPEDTDIPFSTAHALWSAKNSLWDVIDTEDSVREMDELSLFARCDYQNKTFRLHDVIREAIEGDITSKNQRQDLLRDLIKGWGTPSEL
ncbi:MAG TPA: NB-ARC domain-containing protein, partial [Aggregatilineales bacterium]|nr:NB-ARC domain-containing protein [Aggregatilineales bacterium]